MERASRSREAQNSPPKKRRPILNLNAGCKHFAANIQKPIESLVSHASATGPSDEKRLSATEMIFAEKTTGAPTQIQSKKVISQKADLAKWSIAKEAGVL